jgi:uncharacterized protein (TIGR02466 family)
MSHIINLFSVPIFVSSLPEEHTFTKDEIDILKNIKLIKQYGNDGNYLSDDIHVLKNYSLTRIKNLCDSYVSHYVKNVLCIDAEFKMFKSWLSMNQAGTKHEIHAHRNTMISCVMYFDENMSNENMTPINFVQTGLDSIFNTFQFKFETLNSNEYNSSHVKVAPKTGTVIVFPGWVKHGTDESVSNTKRYCLGTNYFFEGTSSSGYHNLTINVE